MHFLTRTLGNLAGLWLSIALVPTIVFQAGDTGFEKWGSLILLAIILGLVSGLVRPVIKVVAFPLYVITLGLFSLVTNAIILTIVAFIAQHINIPFAVESFGGAIAGGLITAIAASVTTAVLGAALTRK